MYRFFVLAWDGADSQLTTLAEQLALRLQRAAPAWRGVLKAPGVLALDAGAERLRHDAYFLHNDAGVAFGKLFAAGAAASTDVPSHLSAADSARIAVTGGRYLLDHYWGRYVAVLRDPSTGRIRILRDPSGALPCFVTSYRGISIFFSDVEDCLALGVLSFSVNWEYIAACSAFLGLKVSATGLKEVTEIMQGEAADVSGAGLRIVQLWDPLEIARSQTVTDARAAIEQARQTVSDCTRAWGSAHRSVMVSLSGGLDSSIVLRCLARELPHTRITAFNHSFAGGYDERKFARIAAEGTGCALRERNIDLATLHLDNVLSAPRSVRPRFLLMDLIHGDFEHQLARETQATAVFSGSGGDHVFLQNGAEYAVGDFLQTHGLRPSLWQVARTAAAVRRQSTWFLLRKGFSAWRRAPDWQPISARYLNHFIAPEVLERFLADPGFARPRVLGSLTGVPVGKLRHIENAMTPYPFYWALPQVDSPDRIAPLFSQPVIELALRLPTWVLIHGGRDRAIERGAFERDVPAQIIQRRSKGCFDNVVRELIEANIDFVRDLLLKGALVERRMLDGKKLEAFLCGPRSGARTEYNELYVTRICTEAWLRRWQNVERRAAA
jgi:asparagine synthase (glutamine-hydrolysing)